MVNFQTGQVVRPKRYLFGDQSSRFTYRAFDLAAVTMLACRAGEALA